MQQCYYRAIPADKQEMVPCAYSEWNGKEWGPRKNITIFDAEKLGFSPFKISNTILSAYPSPWYMVHRQPKVELTVKDLSSHYEMSGLLHSIGRYGSQILNLIRQVSIDQQQYITALQFLLSNERQDGLDEKFTQQLRLLLSPLQIDIFLYPYTSSSKYFSSFKIEDVRDLLLRCIAIELEQYDIKRPLPLVAACCEIDSLDASLSMATKRYCRDIQNLAFANYDRSDATWQNLHVRTIQELNHFESIIHSLNAEDIDRLDQRAWTLFCAIHSSPFLQQQGYVEWREQNIPNLLKHIQVKRYELGESEAHWLGQADELPDPSDRIDAQDHPLTQLQRQFFHLNLAGQLADLQKHLPKLLYLDALRYLITQDSRRDKSYYRILLNRDRTFKILDEKINTHAGILELNLNNQGCISLAGKGGRFATFSEINYYAHYWILEEIKRVDPTYAEHIIIPARKDGMPWAGLACKSTTLQRFDAFRDLVKQHLPLILKAKYNLTSQWDIDDLCQVHQFLCRLIDGARDDGNFLFQATEELLGACAGVDYGSPEKMRDQFLYPLLVQVECHMLKQNLDTFKPMISADWRRFQIDVNWDYDEKEQVNSTFVQAVEDEEYEYCALLLSHDSEKILAPHQNLWVNNTN